MDAARAYEIRQALASIAQSTILELDELTTKYGALDAQATRAKTMQAMRAMQAMQAIKTIRAMLPPPARVGPTTSVALPVTVTPPVTGGAAQVPVSTLDPGSVGHLAQVPGAPVPPRHPVSRAVLSDAAGTEVGSLGHSRLDPPVTAPGATAAEPLATETIVTPSLAATSSFWLQPVDPAPVPGTVSFDSGVQHTSESVHPLPSPPHRAAPRPLSLPALRSPTPSWPDDDFPVERALIAGELAAGQLPIRTIDLLTHGYRATDGGGGNTLYIEHLRSVKESIERALRAAYPGRVDRERFDQVRELLRLRDELAARSAALATPVLSTGAPPGWLGAETPGFARAASGSVELPFSHRQEIAHRFRTDDALLEAELALQTGGAGALGWSSTRWRAVLADLYRLHAAILRSDSAAAAATVDVDWNAIEALMPILDIPLPSP